MGIYDSDVRDPPYVISPMVCTVVLGIICVIAYFILEKMDEHTAKLDLHPCDPVMVVVRPGFTFEQELMAMPAGPSSIMTSPVKRSQSHREQERHVNFPSTERDDEYWLFK